MKKHFLSSILTAAMMIAPSIAGANGTDTHPRIDSDLTFSFRMTSQGETSVRRNRESSRFETTRFGVREVLEILAEFRSLEIIDGEDPQPDFPRGSRLMATREGGVWVVDRDRNPVFDASSYLTFGIDRSNGVMSENSNSSRGQFRSVTLANGYFEINLAGMIKTAEEAIAADSPSGEVSGQLTDRYSSRFNRFNDSQTETQRINGNMSGSGFSEEGVSRLEGNIRLSGRRTSSTEL